MDLGGNLGGNLWGDLGGDLGGETKKGAKVETPARYSKHTELLKR